jgi:hypothetical protein
VSRRLPRAAPALGLFLLVLGAKLALIGQLGPTAPDWDQWGQEADRVYVPWLEGRFGIDELFSWAGVHQRPWSRLLALALLEANGGQWDPQVQQIFGAFLHAAVMAGAAALVAQRLGPGAGAVSLAVLAICLVFPYAWRNTLWGFQSHIHILLGFSLASIFGLIGCASGSAGWTLGVVSGFCAVYAAGSGFVAGAACAATAAAQALLGRRTWRNAAPTLAAGAAMTALGLALLAVGSARDATGENNFRVLRGEPGEGALARPLALLSAVGGVLGWPLPSAGLAGWLLYAPFLVFVWRWIRRGARLEDGAQARLDAAQTLLVALGAWAFVQALGLSALRSGALTARHRDLVFFGPWVNALALLLLLRASAPRSELRRLAGRAAAALFAVALGTGFALQGAQVARREIPEWRRELDQRVATLQLFLATDDPSHFEGKPRRSLPHPRPELLVRLLRDPALRAILPPSIRDALPLEPEAGSWRAGGVPPTLVPASPEPGRAVLGSYARALDAGAAHSSEPHAFRSVPMRSAATALEFAVAGAAEPGSGGGPLLAVRWHDAQDGSPLGELPLAPLSARSWHSVRVRAPGAERAFRIEAHAPADPSRGWLALAAPKEVGPLGYRLVPLTRPVPAAALALAGAALIAAGALARRARPRGAAAPSVLAVLALLALGCGPRGGTRIVLVTLDTLRYDCLPAAPEGPERMPRTRRFAERGVRFAAHRTASSTTQPTHATLLTGLQPWEHGVVRNGLVLPDELTTVAERLGALGYESAAVVASTPLHRRFGFAQGFDHFVDEFSEDARPRLGGAPEDPDEEFYSDAESVTRSALRLLGAMRAPRQFLWVHYFDAHAPYGDAGDGESIRIQALNRALRRGDPGFPELLRSARARYDADVAYLDRWLETLLLRLDADAERWETHLVVVADHGESFGEDGSLFHGKRLTPAQTHVPSFLVSPRVAPRIEEATVGTLDLAATLLSLAGDPAGIPAGRDLSRPEVPPQPVFGMRRAFSKPFKEIRTDGRVHLAEGPYFYVVEGGRSYLGNAAAVADEAERPVVGPEAERVRALFATFEERLSRGSAPETTDPETLRALEALGYVR